MPRLLIASPYPAMRAGLRTLLQNTSGMNVIGEADTVAAVRAIYEGAADPG